MFSEEEEIVTSSLGIKPQPIDVLEMSHPPFKRRHIILTRCVCAIPRDSRTLDHGHLTHPARREFVPSTRIPRFCQASCIIIFLHRVTAGWRCWGAPSIRPREGQGGARRERDSTEIVTCFFAELSMLDRARDSVYWRNQRPIHPCTMRRRRPCCCRSVYFLMNDPRVSVKSTWIVHLCILVCTLLNSWDLLRGRPLFSRKTTSVLPAFEGRARVYSFLLYFDTREMRWQKDCFYL